MRVDIKTFKFITVGNSNLGSDHKCMTHDLNRSEIQETEFIAQAGIASSSDSAMSMPVEPSSDDSRSDHGSLSPLQVFIMI